MEINNNVAEDVNELTAAGGVADPGALWQPKTSGTCGNTSISSMAPLAVAYVVSTIEKTPDPRLLRRLSENAVVAAHAVANSPAFAVMV